MCRFLGNYFINLKRTKSLYIAILVIIMLFAGGCRRAVSIDDQSTHIFVMGTVFEIRAICQDPEQLLPKAEEVLYDLDRKISAVVSILEDPDRPAGILHLEDLDGQVYIEQSN